MVKSNYAYEDSVVKKLRLSAFLLLFLLIGIGAGEPA